MNRLERKKEKKKKTHKTEAKERKRKRNNKKIHFTMKWTEISSQKLNSYIKYKYWVYVPSKQMYT